MAPLCPRRRASASSRRARTRPTTARSRTPAAADPLTPHVPPPPAARVDDVVETLHGIEVADPYRWLEDGESADTAAWVAAQNDRTRAVLDALPQRAWAAERLERLLRAPTATTCRLAGDRLFVLERGGDRDQAVVVLRSATDPTLSPRTLVDPAGLAADAAVAVDWFHPSPDGRLLAYGLSEGGDERSTLHVLDVDGGDDLPDRILHTRAASVAWLPDGSAFAYTRYPAPEAVGDEESEYHRHVWWHVLGDDPGHDELVFGDLPDKTAWPDVSISPDGRWLLIHVSLGWSRTDVHVVDRTSGERTTVVAGEEATTAVEIVGDRLYGHTTLDAPRGRVISALVAEPHPHRWTTIVPEGDGVIEGTSVAGRSLLVRTTEVAVARLRRVLLDGGGEVDVDLPGTGAFAGFDADDGAEVAFFTFESFARPATLHRWTPGTVEPWAAGDDLAVDAGSYVVDQVRYASSDGTEIPMFLVRAGATEPSADTPVLLNGYGGFAIANGPVYSTQAVAVCDAGGIWAVACIRGGFEYGEEWHRAGMREHKQQVFDDFHAAADWLVAEGLTSRARLAIRGGSNGGLLVGAALTQRPDLCRAAICAVPLLDMVRFHLFLIARLWIPEYGDPDVPEELAWLLAYSPYHHVDDGTCYPATLLLTADRDSRVDPAHARKMGARLQAATSCGGDRPVLVRVETRAGHGQGKPVGKQVDEGADAIGFLLWQLGVPDLPPSL